MRGIPLGSQISFITCGLIQPDRIIYKENHYEIKELQSDDNALFNAPPMTEERERGRERGECSTKGEVVFGYISSRVDRKLRI